MEMLLFSFLGSMLAYFAFLSAASSAASAQSASATNWPPTAAQQSALEEQIARMVDDLTGSPLTDEERAELRQGIAGAPAAYVATLNGATPTMAGYQSWVLTSAIGHINQSTAAA
jgi:hypothetical protein